MAEPAPEVENTVERAKENREAAVKRIAQSGVTVDKVQGDPTYGWTAQHGAAPAELAAIVGQVFVPRQLPDPEVQQAWGIDPQAHAAGLEVVSDEVGLEHPGGPEADEAQRLGLVGTAYKDKTPDAKVGDWMSGRLVEGRSDLVEEVESAEADREKETQKKVDTEGLSVSQAHAVTANVPDEGTGAVSDEAKDSGKSETKANANRGGRTPSQAGSQTSGSEGAK